MVVCFYLSPSKSGLMGSLQTTILLFLSFLLLLDPSFSFPLCTNSMAPFVSKTPLQFCHYSGSVCCNSTQDSQLQKQFQAMNVSNSACSTLLRSVLCATCDPFSADLFTVSTKPRTVPLLCNSSQSTSSGNFCSKLWDTCQNITIPNSPFEPSSLWQSKTDFCNAFGGASSDVSVCFNGEKATLNATTLPDPPKGMCLEKIGNGSYLNMVAHPDGSNRAFFANQQGKIWLATLPKVGSGGSMGLNEADPFLDLTDVVHFDSGSGMMGIAFHPKFTENGRFFASFNCDKSKWTGCSGRCACNSDANCDPSTLPPDNGAQPCQIQSVVAEYTANGTTSPSSATVAKPSEVRRIFTMGLPFTSHHAGQILFEPNDGYMFFMMGDGGGSNEGSSADPYNFAQNKKTPLGKIMRLDVDNIPSAAEINKYNLWGNYSLPLDNPFTIDNQLLPEIWALGFRNPWRCSLDSKRPSYFMCADVGQDQYEEVDIVTKGGNYGWRVYEGPYLYTSTNSPGGNTSANSINAIFPVMGYNHTEVNKNEGSASITGGYFYRSNTDPCMTGRYLYADLYASALWQGIENPEGSGTFTTTQIPFSCASDSPIKCTTAPGTPDAALGYIFSFGEDNNKDIYILTSNGVYRVVQPSRCKYTCSKENATAVATPSPSSSPTSPASRPYDPCTYIVLLVSSILLCLLGFV